MECSFSLDHYEHIIRCALEAGYVFRGFHEPACGDSMQLFLRHDVDVSLNMALRMAEVEAKLGVRSTYFVLPNSPIYNILDNESIDMILQIAAMGHWIGLHIDLPKTCVMKNANIEQVTYSMFDFFLHFLPLTPVVSFHRPSERVFGMKLLSLVNTYEDRFFRDIKYISDSRGQWREGCPCKILSSGEYSSVQLLIHPVWWITQLNLERAWDLLVKSRDKIMIEYLASNVSPFKALLSGSN